MEKSIESEYKKVVGAICSVWPTFHAATTLNWNYGKPSSSKYLKDFIDDADINWSSLSGKQKGTYFVSIFCDLQIQNLLSDELDAFDFVCIFFDEIFDCFIPENDRDAMRVISACFQALSDVKKGNKESIEQLLKECAQRKTMIKLVAQDKPDPEQAREESLEMQLEIEQEKQEKKQKGIESR